MSDTKLKYVLVVEDQQIDRRTLTEMLNRYDYYVLFAHDTLNALKMLTEVQPAMVIVGFEQFRPDRYTFTRILKNDHATEGIMVVALSDGGAMENMMPIGFDGFISIGQRGQDISQDVKELLLINNY